MRARGRVQICRWALLSVGCSGAYSEVHGGKIERLDLLIVSAHVVAPSGPSW